MKTLDEYLEDVKDGKYVRAEEFDKIDVPKLIQMSDFNFYKYDVTNGRRDEETLQYGFDYSNKYEGDIKISDEQDGNTDVTVDWDPQGTPDNWEDVEDFVNENLEEIFQIAEKI